MGGPLVYALTRDGAERMVTANPDLATQQERLGQIGTDLTDRNRALKPWTVEHILAVARFRTALSPAVRAGIRIERWHREVRQEQKTRRRGWDDPDEDKRFSMTCNWSLGKGNTTLTPDGFLVMRDDRENGTGSRAAFFLEADRSTMQSTRMAAKYERYIHMREARMHKNHFGVPAFRVLTVCKSRDRALNLRAVVRGEFVPPYRKHPLKVSVPPALRKLFLFATEEDFAEHPENLLAAIWYSAEDDAHERQVPLITPAFPRAG
jgi:hypothetical protein